MEAIEPAIEIDASSPELTILTPFAEKQYIDMYRTCEILGLSHSAVRSLYERGLIKVLDFRQGGRKRVRYQSVADLCDNLRERHCIKDRRPPLGNAMFRHRDTDLLPFPLSDTMTVPEARNAIGYESSTPVLYLCEEGAFEAYQFYKGSPWRISRVSLARCLSGLHMRQQSPLQTEPTGSSRQIG